MAGRFDLVKRAPWILAGLALAALGLGLDSLGLDSSPGMGITQVECLVLGTLLAVVSALPLPPSHTFVWMARVLLVLVVLAAAAELAAMALTRFGGGPAAPAAAGGDREGAPGPDFDFAPFVLWRVRPGYSDGISSVDGMGIRGTSPPETESEDAFQVVLLGGSSVWGWGLPDSGTVASHLQAGLDELLARPVRVVNLAQPGWTVTQQVIALMLEIRAGARPDLVLLHAGLHDAAAAAVGSRVDPEWLAQAATAWNGQPGTPSGPPEGILEVSAAASVLAPALGLDHRTASEGMDGTCFRLPSPIGSPDSMAEVMAGEAAGAMAIARSIAGSCGTRCVLILRPCWPVSRRLPSEEERDLLLPSIDSTSGADYLRTAWQALRDEAGRSPWFLDLSGSLDSVPGHLFTGPDDLTSLGNEMVAREMVDELASRGLLW